MIGNQNIPKLRFPGFDGAWETKSVYELASKLNVGFVGTCEPFYTNSSEGILLVRTGNLKGVNIVLDEEKYVSKEFHNKNKKSQIFPGDLLLARHGGNGEICMVPKEFPAANCLNIVILKTNSLLDSVFFQLAYSSYSVQKQISSVTAGSTQGVINTKEIGKLNIIFPSLPEQQKIASFLSAVDEKIQQLSRKKELLEQYKKGVMQQLFSGKLRFKDENGNEYPEWEEKKLGDIGIFQTSSIDKLSKENELEVYLVNYMNVYRHEEINNNTIKHFQVVTAKENQIRSCDLRKGDILFTPSSETPTDIGHSVVIFEDIENAVYSYHLMRFRPKLKMDILYSHYFCNIPEVLNQLSKLATGSTRFTISVKSFSSIEVKLPCFNEQQKIANFLSSIDAKIENTKGELEKVQLFKKGLLQQLFV